MKKFLMVPALVFLLGLFIASGLTGCPPINHGGEGEGEGEGESVVEGEAAIALVLDSTALTVTENHTVDFHVKLSAQPAADLTVTVTRVTGTSTFVVQSGASLVFTSANWSTYQRVRLAATHDANTNDDNSVFACSAPGLITVNVALLALDDDTGEGEGEGTAGEVRVTLLPGAVPLELVWVPAGTFQMGRYAGETESFDWEDPQHEVTLSKGFWMGKYEFTQAQWKAVMNGANPSQFQGAAAGNVNTDNRPVDSVSWNDVVQNFLPALNLATGLTFRLPTEAEWEYACRGGSQTRFYWGEDSGYADMPGYAWFSVNGALQTHDVGGKTANAFGLFDMSGNVTEWVQDWYAAYDIGSVTNPTGPVSGTDRGVRGGDFSMVGSSCRSAYRGHDVPEDVDDFTGFRLIR